MNINSCKTNRMGSNAGANTHRACVPLGFLMLVLLFACGHVVAQQDQIEEEWTAEQAKTQVEPESGASQKVDESEENFRRRMELRDQRFRQRPRADMSYTPQVGNGKLDLLPEASREHIKDQMREMIISSHQWQPGEDLSDYPYQPSTAAEEDARLHEREREAWVEQVQKYQQREAAAYAASRGGQSGQAGEQQSSAGDQNGQQQNSSEQSAADAGSDSQSPAESSQQASADASHSTSTEQVSTEGVSESALSFLQGAGGSGQQMASAGQTGQNGQAEQDSQNGQANQAGEEGQADEQQTEVAAAEDEGSTASEPAPPGSLALSELAMLQGQTTASEAGTLNIDELQNFRISNSQDGQTVLIETTNQTSETATQMLTEPTPALIAPTPLEPGTLEIIELDNLQTEGN